MRIHRGIPTGLLVSAVAVAAASSAVTAAAPLTIPKLDLAVQAIGGTEATNPRRSILNDVPQLELIYSPIIGTDRTNRELCACDGLAESWEVSDDGLTFTIHLRDGVKFHDGTDLTSEDVKFSLERLSEDGTTATGAPQFNREVTSVDAPDPSTVVIHLAHPSLQFARLLSTLGGGMSFVVPKAYLTSVGEEAFRANPIGSGPYKLVSHATGSSMDFQAFDDYFLGRPTVDEIAMQIVTEQATRNAMLDTGDADIIDISHDQIGSLTDKGYKVFDKPEGEINVLYYHYRPEYGDAATNPLVDPKVREALATSIDVNGIIEFLMGGRGTPNGLWGLGGVGSEALPAPVYDPDAARQLLRDAGYEDGAVNLTLYVTLKAGNAEYPAIGQAIAAGWEDIGVRVNVVPIDWATLRPMLADKSIQSPSVRLEAVGAPQFWDTTAQVVNFCEGPISAVCEPDSEHFVTDAQAAPTIEEFGADMQAYNQYLADHEIVAPLFSSGPAVAAKDIDEWDLGGSAYSRNYRYLYLPDGFDQ